MKNYYGVIHKTTTNPNVEIETTIEDVVLVGKAGIFAGKVGTKATIIGGKVVWKVGPIGG